MGKPADRDDLTLFAPNGGAVKVERATPHRFWWLHVLLAWAFICVFHDLGAEEAQLVFAAPPTSYDRLAGASGWVMVHYRISTEGTVTDASIVDHCVWAVRRFSSLECVDRPDPRFDAAALEAIQRYRYRPATDADGRPRTSTRRAKILFQRDATPAAVLTSLYSGDAESLPERRQEYPQMPGSVRWASLKARKAIGEGNLKKVRKVRASLRKLEEKTAHPDWRAAMLADIAWAELALGHGDAASATAEAAIATVRNNKKVEERVLQSAVDLYLGRDWLRVVELIDRYHVLRGHLTEGGLLLKSLAWLELDRPDAMSREVAAVTVLLGESPRLQALVAAAGRLAIGRSDSDSEDALLLRSERSMLVTQFVTEDYRPTRKKPAEYPKDAMTDRVSGWVILQFTIDRGGDVKDGVVLAHCASSASTDGGDCKHQPDPMFDRAALDALRDYRFEPRRIRGEAVETRGVVERMTFSLESIEVPQPAS